jgi:hypothetical protein
MISELPTSSRIKVAEDKRPRKSVQPATFEAGDWNQAKKIEAFT